MPPMIKVGGIVNHKPSGYGFKITCEKTMDARFVKAKIIEVMEKYNFKVENTIGYFDEGAH